MTPLLAILVPLLGCAPSWSDTALPADFDGDGDGILSAVDCDDDDPQIGPGLPERCNNIDDDCDGAIDDDDPEVIPPTIWADTDSDGYGAARVQAASCAAADASPGPLVGGDCDDTNASVNPGTEERCNGIDDDCSGGIDDSPTDGVDVWLDLDADGYGRKTQPTRRCAPAAGEVAQTGDCDDLDGLVSPAAVERCNDVDDDCDGAIDDDDDDVTYDPEHQWFADLDQDGWGAPNTGGWSCVLPGLAATSAGDCDDADPTRWPGAAELCNSIDDDCDERIDDEPEDGSIFYIDLDQDGFGNGAQIRRGCTRPPGTTEVRGDCNDLDSRANPGRVEQCDGIDNDCDGLTDDSQAAGLPGSTLWYLDADSDGDGDPDSAPQQWCVAPKGRVSVAGDCDDGEPLRSSLSPELCNDSIDNNCDNSRAPCGPLGEVSPSRYPELDTLLGPPDHILGSVRDDSGADHLWVSAFSELHRVAWQSDTASWTERVQLTIPVAYSAVREGDFDSDGRPDTLALFTNTNVAEDLGGFNYRYRFPVIPGGLTGHHDPRDLFSLLVDPPSRFANPQELTTWPPAEPGGTAGVALTMFYQNNDRRCTLHQGPFTDEQQLLSTPSLAIVDSRTPFKTAFCYGDIGDLDGDGVGELAVVDRYGDSSRRGSVVLLSSADLHALGTGQVDIAGEPHLYGASPNANLGLAYGRPKGDHDGDGRDDVFFLEDIDDSDSLELFAFTELPSSDSTAIDLARTVLSVDPLESLTLSHSWHQAGQPSGLWVAASTRDPNHNTAVYGFHTLPPGMLTLADATAVLQDASYVRATGDFDADGLDDMVLNYQETVRLIFGETL